MKSLRYVLLAVTLLSFATLTIAQEHEHGAPNKPAANAATSDAPKPSQKPQLTETQKSFNAMKAFAGEWEGHVTVDPPQPQWKSDNGLHISMRVTSRGNVIVHELQEANTPLDWMKYDHPVTMLYMDNDQLQLIHYCDAGNRPHMTGKASADGRSFDFTFSELSGNNKYGHMHHGTFTLVDADHHIEEWTWMAPNDKPIHVRMDLHRVQPSTTAVAAK